MSTQHGPPAGAADGPPAHAPGAPGVVYELADPTSSTPEALSAIEGRFPAAALARLELNGDWSGVATASLVSVRIPGQARSRSTS